MANLVRRKFIDIGANLTGEFLVHYRIDNDVSLLPDSMYQGIYNGKQSHSPDLKHVLQRAIQYGLEKVAHFFSMTLSEFVIECYVFCLDYNHWGKHGGQRESFEFGQK